MTHVQKRAFSALSKMSILCIFSSFFTKNDTIYSRTGLKQNKNTKNNTEVIWGVFSCHELSPPVYICRIASEQKIIKNATFLCKTCSQRLTARISAVPRASYCTKSTKKHKKWCRCVRVQNGVHIVEITTNLQYFRVHFGAARTRVCTHFAYTLLPVAKI
jgi:hypothetical protein